MTIQCHCGKPLHYTDPRTQEFIEKMADQYGQYIEVNLSGIKYKVQRHYMALHGIKGSELPSLGFEVMHDRI